MSLCPRALGDCCGLLRPRSGGRTTGSAMSGLKAALPSPRSAPTMLGTMNMLGDARGPAPSSFSESASAGAGRRDIWSASMPFAK